MAVEQHLGNDMFLKKLTEFYADSKIRGPKSVYVTMKAYDGRTRAVPKDMKFENCENVSCLFRAKWGNKKISTVVEAKEVNKFQTEYAQIIIAQMVNLKNKKKEGDKKKMAVSKA